MRDDFQVWVDAVCGEVRFWPDREGIAKELRVHYEDHCKALERLHYEPDLAAERSLRAMGDAREVGRALDRVHRPWLGWLWVLSRWMVRGLAMLLVMTMLWSVDWNILIKYTRDELDWEEPPAGTARVELEHGTLWAAPGDVTEEEGYTVAEVRLWIKTRDPLAMGAGMKTLFFSWRDDLGELPILEYDSLSRTWTESRYWCYNVEKSSSGWTCFFETVKLVLDQPPRWAEVSYPLSGQDWVLRVEWEAAS